MTNHRAFLSALLLVSTFKCIKAAQNDCNTSTTGLIPGIGKTGVIPNLPADAKGTVSLGILDKRYSLTSEYFLLFD